MSAALCALHDCIKADPRPYKNLIPSFTSILKQVRGWERGLEEGQPRAPMLESEEGRDHRVTGSTCLALRITQRLKGGVCRGEGAQIKGNRHRSTVIATCISSQGRAEVSS